MLNPISGPKAPGAPKRPHPTPEETPVQDKYEDTRGKTPSSTPWAEKGETASHPSTAGVPGVPAWGQSMTGDIRYHEVHSDILKNERPVLVYLPPGYHDHPEKHYPVLYACDGQNLFERGTSFGGQEWQMDESAQRLIDSGQMKDTIIVAVANAGAGRTDEYTPVPDPRHGGGHADDFAKFMIDELKPMIDNRYRTLTTAKDTGITGSSLGGLVSLYLGFNHPAVYGLVGALSPSLWWAGKDMIKAIAEAPVGQGPQKIWLSMGDQEGDEDENHNGVLDTLDNTRELSEVLKKRGFQEGKTFFYREYPGAGHNEGSWREQTPELLSILYPS